jgi:hypothetical protein
MIYIEYRFYLCIQSVSEGGDNGEIGPKRRASRRLGPRCIFFFYLHFFFVFSTKQQFIFILNIGSIYVQKGNNDNNEWAAAKKTGPNDVSGVVWALDIYI